MAKVAGGRADKAGKTASDFPAAAVAEGARVEAEHTADPELREDIAVDHLTEDPKSYKKLKRMEAGACDKGATEKSVTARPETAVRGSGDEGSPDSKANLEKARRRGPSRETEHPGFTTAPGAPLPPEKHFAKRTNVPAAPKAAPAAKPAPKPPMPPKPPEGAPEPKPGEPVEKAQTPQVPLMPQEPEKKPKMQEPPAKRAEEEQAETAAQEQQEHAEGEEPEAKCMQAKKSAGDYALKSMTGLVGLEEFLMKAEGDKPVDQDEPKAGGKHVRLFEGEPEEPVQKGDDADEDDEDEDEDEGDEGGPLPADAEAKVRKFLADNPNSPDAKFHEFAESLGVAPAKLEAVAYKLATAQVKKSGMAGLDAMSEYLEKAGGFSASHKYIKRTGAPGAYIYTYPDEPGQKPAGGGGGAKTSPAFKVGNIVKDPSGRHVPVVAVDGDNVTVQLGGSYGAHVKYPASTLELLGPGLSFDDWKPPTDAEAAAPAQHLPPGMAAADHHAAYKKVMQDGLDIAKDGDEWAGKKTAEGHGEAWRNYQAAADKFHHAKRVAPTDQQRQVALDHATKFEKLREEHEKSEAAAKDAESAKAAGGQAEGRKHSLPVVGQTMAVPHPAGGRRLEIVNTTEGFAKPSYKVREVDHGKIVGVVDGLRAEDVHAHIQNFEGGAGKGEADKLTAMSPEHKQLAAQAREKEAGHAKDYETANQAMESGSTPGKVALADFHRHMRNAYSAVADAHAHHGAGNYGSAEENHKSAAAKFKRAHEANQHGGADKLAAEHEQAAADVKAEYQAAVAESKKPKAPAAEEKPTEVKPKAKAQTTIVTGKGSKLVDVHHKAGHYLVHKNEDGKGWSVTHGPSGKRLRNVAKKSDARALADHLHQHAPGALAGMKAGEDLTEHAGPNMAPNVAHYKKAHEEIVQLQGALKSFKPPVKKQKGGGAAEKATEPWPTAARTPASKMGESEVVKELDAHHKALAAAGHDDAPNLKGMLARHPESEHYKNPPKGFTEKQGDKPSRELLNDYLTDARIKRGVHESKMKAAAEQGKAPTAAAQADAHYAAAEKEEKKDTIAGSKKADWHRAQAAKVMGGLAKVGQHGEALTVPSGKAGGGEQEKAPTAAAQGETEQEHMAKVTAAYRAHQKLANEGGEASNRKVYPGDENKKQARIAAAQQKHQALAEEHKRLFPKSGAAGQEKPAGGEQKPAEPPKPVAGKPSVKESGGYMHEEGKHYADTSFINSASAAAKKAGFPNAEIKHLGFGEFDLDLGNGRTIGFNRRDSKKVEGFSGRTHEMYGDQADIHKVVSAVGHEPGGEIKKSFAGLDALKEFTMEKAMEGEGTVQKDLPHGDSQDLDQGHGAASPNGGVMDAGGAGEMKHPASNGPGFDANGQVTGVPAAKQEVLSDDDRASRLVDQMGKSADGMKGLPGTHQPEAPLRKSVQPQSGAHPLSSRAFHAPIDEQASQLAKSEEFYQGNAPGAPGSNLLSQGVLCKSCNHTHPAMITTCPNCGAGAVNHRMPMGMQVGQSFQPARREPDVYIPGPSPVMTRR